jgi:dihydroorotase-like cyclic amidohydrolase
MRPHAVEEKEGATIWDMACGFPGVQTSLTLMLQAVQAGRMTLPEVVRVMAGAPARTFGLSDRKGAIAPRMDADLVVVDMDMQETLGAERLLSRGKVSVYEGWEVTGAPVMTFVRGDPGGRGRRHRRRHAARAHGAPAYAAARAAQHGRPRCRPFCAPETCPGKTAAG